MALWLLEDQPLYEKHYYYTFVVQEMEYLGHIVFNEGVKVNHRKIASMMERVIHNT